MPVPVAPPAPSLNASLSLNTPQPSTSRWQRRLVALALAAGGLLAPAWAAAPAAVTRPCDQPSLVVRKRDGVVELACQGQIRGRFLATFGQNPVGPKLREGDERTPEGQYHISSRVETPRFHRFLGVSYPNADDIRRAKALGITRMGGGIGIHGVEASKNTLARIWLRLGHTLGLNRLWGPTDGCIGVTNEDIEVLYAATRVGTPVVINP